MIINPYRFSQDIPFSNVNSFSFDGVDDYFLGTSTYSEIDGLGNFAFSFWIKPSVLIGFRQILTIGTNSADYRNQQIQIACGGNAIQVYVSSTSYYWRSTDGSLTQDVWQHILVTRDSTRPIGQKGKVYINGVDESSADNTRYWTNNTPSNSGLMIGRHNNGWASLFSGKIDEVAVYTQDMASYVSEIYGGGQGVDLNNLATAPQPTTWQRMGENATWNGATWTMTDVNGGYTNRSINMVEANRTTDVPPNPFANTQSILLDGVDDYVSVADADNLSFGNGVTDSPFSISFWVNLDSLSGQNNVFIGKDNGSPNREYVIGMFSNSDKVRFFIKNNGGNNQQSIDSTTQLTIGSWFHIVTTYSGVGGSNAADGMKIYINGSLETSTNVIKQSYTAMKNTTAPLTIGKYNASASQISGTMDEVSVFNSELSQSDVSAIYGGGVPSSLSSYSSLVSWWRFEGSGTTAIDSGSGGNNGTLVNGVVRSTDVPLFNTKSIALDGVDDFVEVGYIAELNNASAFTYSGWYKQTTLDQERFLMGFFVSAGNWFGLYTWSDGNMYIHFKDGGVNKYGAFDYSTLVTANAWFNIVIVFNGSNSTNADRLKCYINNTQATLSFVGTQPTNTPIGANNLTLGKMDSFTQTWLGGADELALWNTDESANVSTIYNSGVPNDISSLSPLSWWRCGDGDTSPTLTDNGSSGNDGTMTNFTTFSTDVPT